MTGPVDSESIASCDVWKRCDVWQHQRNQAALPGFWSAPVADSCFVGNE